MYRPLDCNDNLYQIFNKICCRIVLINHLWVLYDQSPWCGPLLRVVCSIFCEAWTVNFQLISEDIWAKGAYSVNKTYDWRKPLETRREFVDCERLFLYLLHYSIRCSVLMPGPVIYSLKKVWLEIHNAMLQFFILCAIVRLSSISFAIFGPR